MSHQRNPYNTDELIQEIELLLNFGEGEHHILDATGYTGRPKSLHERLRTNHRTDLNHRIFGTEAGA